MHRDTTERIRAAKARAAADGVTLEDRIRNAAANAAERAADQMPERTLPDVGPEVDLVTVTLHELHDLIYNAASTSLHESMPSMTKTNRQTNAQRIADQALLIVRGQDYTHRGADPRG